MFYILGPIKNISILKIDNQQIYNSENPPMSSADLYQDIIDENRRTISVAEQLKPKQCYQDTRIFYNNDERIDVISDQGNESYNDLLTFFTKEYGMGGIQKGHRCIGIVKTYIWHYYFEEIFKENLELLEVAKSLSVTALNEIDRFFNIKIIQKHIEDVVNDLENITPQIKGIMEMLERLNRDDKKLRRKTTPTTEHVKWVCNRKYLNGNRFNNEKFKSNLSKVYKRARTIRRTQNKNANYNITRLVLANAARNKIKVPNGEIIRGYTRP